MKTKSQFESVVREAVEADIVAPEQAQKLLDLWAKHSPSPGAFSGSNVLMYFGGLVAIGAMTLFMNLGWELFGGWGMFSLALVYALAGGVLALRFEAIGSQVAAGISVAFVISVTPLAIYGAQIGLGWWPDDSTYQDYHRLVSWHWIYLELGTLLIGVLLLWRFSYPFMLLPISITLWYLSMDAVDLLLGQGVEADRGTLSACFGLIMTAAAWFVERRSRSSLDYAFWLYLFGLLTLWGGLTLKEFESELGKASYFAMNLALLTLGTVLRRRTFLVFGGLGSAGYLGYLAADVFADSMLFPFVLTLLGLMLVIAGMLLQRHGRAIGDGLRRVLGAAVRSRL